jgi:hypothetical protein
VKWPLKHREEAGREEVMRVRERERSFLPLQNRF